MTRRAILALENGTTFEGIAIGIDGQSVGEVVFNTSMSGYQEILTDPSYAEQIVTLTHPHIGNTGVTSEDEESNNIWAKGLIIRDLPLTQSNWRSESSLEDYLRARNVVAIAGIDTRKLTGLLRDEGSLKGAIICGTDLSKDVAESAIMLQKHSLACRVWISPGSSALAILTTGHRVSGTWVRVIVILLNLTTMLSLTILV